MPAIWGNVPQRNKNFTGRVALLEELRARLTGEVGQERDVTAVLAHALHGMGGVGKTQLAVEYAYRYAHEYDLVWWVPADQIPLVRSSLASLAPRLGLEGVSPARLEDAINAVTDALRLGRPYERWLIIFDNADQPEEIRDLLPTGSGHVIVTSRNHRWQNVAETVEVDVFSRQESLGFLERRVPGIKPDEAGRLAEELGDLPLALEQAGALQVETGMSVEEYLELLEEESTKVLAENQPTDYPVGVAAAWSLSVTRLQERMPAAWELLRRLAYFGPEPIERDIFKGGRHVLSEHLRAEFADPIMFSRAIRELGRYALVRVDNYHKTLQVHRLIQRLIRDEVDEEQAEMMRHEVHLLLAEYDPQDADEPDNWARYEHLLAHIVPSEAVTCRDPEGRRAVRNVVRFLFNVGDRATCDSLTAEALEQWTQESGPDDADVLILAGQRADNLWAQGDYPGAYELRRATLERMHVALGPEHEETLLVTNGQGADLRARGDFIDALRLDESTLTAHTRVFGVDDPRTFMVASNLAEDQGLNSDYAAALATDRGTHQDRLDFFGRDDHPWVVYSLGAIGRDLRQAGHYSEALTTSEQAYRDFAELVRQKTLAADHAWVLWQAKECSVIRRKMGKIEAALQLAEDVYQRYLMSFGERHPDTLAAGIAVGNARRVHGNLTKNPGLLESAVEQIGKTYEHYVAVLGEHHPFTLGCAVNVAIVRRRSIDEEPPAEDPAEAVARLRGALAGLDRRFGEHHHYTLTCMTELATSLADAGELDEAQEVGRRALIGLRDNIGSDHPHSLACQSNLAIDLRALGDNGAANEFSHDAVERYRQALEEDHPDVRDALAGKRIALDLEPVPL